MAGVAIDPASLALVWAGTCALAMVATGLIALASWWSR